MIGSTRRGGLRRVVPVTTAIDHPKERQRELNTGSPEGHIGQAQVDQVGLSAAVRSGPMLSPEPAGPLELHQGLPDRSGRHSRGLGHIGLGGPAGAVGAGHVGQDHE